MNFKKLRTDMGLTQQELALKLDRPLRWVQRIENGEINLRKMSLENAVILAEFFNIRVEDLLK